MDEQQKLNEFEPPTFEAWLKLVERDLQGAPFEKKLVKRVAGVDIKPLYTKQDTRPEAAVSLPGFPPFTRGNYALGAAEMGWDVRQEVAHGDVSRAAQAVLDNLNGGASSLLLKLDRATRTLGDEHGRDGISVPSVVELSQLLEHVDLEKTPVQLQAGAATLSVAAALLALAKQRGARSEALSGCLGADPLGQLASEGGSPGSLADSYRQAALLASWTKQHAPALRALSVDTTPYHEAGADAATEIALALATGVEYLRALSASLDIDSALSQLQFTFAVGRDFFVEVAKLRAARRVWAQVAKSCGAKPDSEAMLIHAVTSPRTKTQRDPWVNLLRGTAESFSAAVAGADAITTHSFDVALGEPDEFGQRMARNTQHLLRHESNLHRVVDPAGGSWYVESLTHALAERAWAAFQAIEREGGLAKALLSGSLQDKLKAALEQEEKAVEMRKVSITGVNEFPHVREDPVQREQPDFLALAAQATRVAAKPVPAFPDASLEALRDALAQGASIIALQRSLTQGPPERATKLTRRRLAQAIEALRDEADAQLAQRGTRPKVFLANLGPIPEHKARAAYAQNFFEAGGFESLGNDGFRSAEEAAEAFAKSGASVCALCSSDSVYAELAEATARAVAQRGAKAIVLAGSPGEREAAYRTAGVTDFIFVGANLVSTLRALLARAGGV